MTTTKLILLVDDSDYDVELVLEALAKQSPPPEVVVAHDGQEALDYLYGRGAFQGRDARPPVAVLLDLKMPKVDGLEVLRQIKGDTRLERIPVVMLTSSSEERDILRSYELGVNAYVVKPVDFQEFENAIKAIGTFWVAYNEAPPQRAVEASSHSAAVA